MSDTPDIPLTPIYINSQSSRPARSFLPPLPKKRLNDKISHKVNIPIDTILAYAKKGYKSSHIAELLGCSKVNIWRRLKPFAKEIEAAQDYQETRGLRLTISERRLLTRLDKVVDNENVTLSQVSNAFAIIHNAGRLERGQSTISVNSITALAERLELKGNKQKVVDVDAETEDVEDEIDR